MKPIYPTISISIPKNSNPIHIVSHAKAMMRAANVDEEQLETFERFCKTRKYQNIMACIKAWVTVKEE